MQEINLTVEVEVSIVKNKDFDEPISKESRTKQIPVALDETFIALAKALVLREDVDSVDIHFNFSNTTIDCATFNSLLKEVK